jgi:hypothetical protein
VLSFIVFLLFLDLALYSLHRVAAQETHETSAKERTQPSPTLQKLADEVKEGFRYVFGSYFFGNTQKPSDSTQNPSNDFLKIPRYTADIEFRPDFFLEFRRFKLMIKPRFTLDWSRWDDGSKEGDTKTDSDSFVNEWLVRLRLVDSLFGSYGRENLQWGPSYFLSPSNPFFRDNGLSNPTREVPGSDFGRFVWVPSTSWGFSFIANVDEGRQEFISDDFERIYAFKVDYTTYRKYLSLITSYRESDRGRLGAYAGWTVSDAWLLYGESTLSQGTNALYPVEDSTAPLGIHMSNTKNDDNALEGILLLGSSYTFEAGPTFTLEYVYNGEGYNGEEANLYYKLRERAAEAFFLPEPARSLSRSVLTETLDPRLRLLRNHYLFFQYQHSQIWNVLSLIFRYTYNLDDNSNQFNPIVEYAVGDHTRLFLVGRQNFGSDETEFGSIVDYFWSLGLVYTF